MFRIKYLLFMIFCLFFSPLVIFAQCDNQRLSELNKLASNVQFSYTYTLDQNQKPVFTIHMNNLTDDIYVLDGYGNIYSGAGEKNIPALDGEEFEYTFYSNDVNCRDDKIVTRYFKLPFYNELYGSSQCKENPQFKYCNLWGETLVTNEEFIAQYNDYKNEESVSKTIDNDDGFNMDYLIIGFVIVVIAVVLFIVTKRNK